MQETKGEGFSAKLGVIYKVMEYLRLGATITSPAFLTLDDTFGETLNTSYNGGGIFEDGTEYPTTYNLRTPYKASGGMSVFIGQFGFITGDVEYVGYKSTNISSNEYYNNGFDLDIIKKTTVPLSTCVAVLKLRLLSLYHYGRVTACSQALCKWVVSIPKP
ncbi:hypothetical protein [Mucilaginibacter antarcticus]|uniref:hypothetical protein n=1 Tax=Mucilaginibacter antarcticus TaxID=1855725 RepID=UPI003631100E